MVVIYVCDTLLCVVFVAPKCFREHACCHICHYGAFLSLLATHNISFYSI